MAAVVTLTNRSCCLLLILITSHTLSFTFVKIAAFSHFQQTIYTRAHTRVCEYILSRERLKKKKSLFSHKSNPCYRFATDFQALKFGSRNEYASLKQLLSFFFSAPCFWDQVFHCLPDSRHAQRLVRQNEEREILSPGNDV